MPDREYKIDWDDLSPAETAMVFKLYHLYHPGEEGIAEECHCPSCMCDTVRDLSQDERDALQDLHDRDRLADTVNEHGVETWYLLPDYYPDIEERLRYLKEEKQAAAMRAAELAMTPLFPEFQDQFEALQAKENAHV